MRDGESGVVVGIDDGARLLLRGLLRLHRYHVVFDTADPTEAIGLVREHRPSVLIVQYDVVAKYSSQVIPQAREVSPTTRVILVASRALSHLDLDAKGERPDQVLYSPFQLKEFEEALKGVPRELTPVGPRAEVTKE